MDKTSLNKIKGMLREKEKTYADCAKHIGISETSFANKVNGKKKFYIDELNALGDYLEMTGEQKASIFLR